MNQIATITPIRTEELKPDWSANMRQFQSCVLPWMRFQVIRKVDRPLREPVYQGKKLLHTKRTSRTFSAIELLGWGETAEAAQKMAGRAKL